VDTPLKVGEFDACASYLGIFLKSASLPHCKKTVIKMYNGIVVPLKCSEVDIVGTIK